MKTRTQKYRPMCIIYGLASHLVALELILAGISQTFIQNSKLSDMLNIWSFLFMLGCYLESLLNLSRRIIQRFHFKRTKNELLAWRFTLNFSWVVLSMYLASLINDWNYVRYVLDNRIASTNGLSIIAMGLSSIMLYHSYKD